MGNLATDNVNIVARLAAVLSFAFASMPEALPCIARNTQLRSASDMLWYFVGLDHVEHGCDCGDARE
jgi:hypothetical protein